MGTRKAVAIFLGWLLAALVGVSAVTIYGFGYFEGALGGRSDNLMLNVTLYAGAALAIAVGFATVLSFRGAATSLRGLHLFFAALTACALLHGLALAGPFLERFGSWEGRLGVVILYCVFLGALTAAVLMRFANAREHAA